MKKDINKLEWVDSWIKTISIKTYDENNNVIIEISDNAMGIPKDSIDKGTGLGLSISYGIIKNFGGKIKVESISGNGSTFIISIPKATKLKP